jgi:hypothetical protein
MATVWSCGGVYIGQVRLGQAKVANLVLQIIENLIQSLFKILRQPFWRDCGSLDTQVLLDTQSQHGSKNLSTLK